MAGESAKGLRAIASLIDISELPHTDLDAALRDSGDSLRNFLGSYSCVLVATEVCSVANIVGIFNTAHSSVLAWIC